MRRRHGRDGWVGWISSSAMRTNDTRTSWATATPFGDGARTVAPTCRSCFMLVFAASVGGLTPTFRAGRDPGDTAPPGSTRIAASNHGLQALRLSRKRLCRFGDFAFRRRRHTVPQRPALQSRANRQGGFAGFAVPGAARRLRRGAPFVGPEHACWSLHPASPDLDPIGRVSAKLPPLAPGRQAFHSRRVGAHRDAARPVQPIRVRKPRPPRRLGTNLRQIGSNRQLEPCAAVPGRVGNAHVRRSLQKGRAALGCGCDSGLEHLCRIPRKNRVHGAWNHHVVVADLAHVKVAVLAGPA